MSTFVFDALLSAAATNRAKPFTGYPAYHFVGGNIDEPTVPSNALAKAVNKVIRDDGHAMARYGMESGPKVIYRSGKPFAIVSIVA